MTVVLLWDNMLVCLQLLIGVLNYGSFLLVFWDSLSNLKCACVVSVCILGEQEMNCHFQCIGCEMKCL